MDADDFPPACLVRRGPGRRTAARAAGPDHRSNSWLLSRFPGPAACALLSAGLATPPPHFMVEMNTPPRLMKVRRNRRAPGSSVGGKHGDDGRLRPELTGFPPVVGDHQIADCSAANPRYDFSVSARFSLRICVIWVICGQIAMDGRPLCLRIFVFAMSFSVFLSVFLCLCGLTGSCLYVTASPAWRASRDFGLRVDRPGSVPRPSRAPARRATRARLPGRPPPATARGSGRRSSAP